MLMFMAVLQEDGLTLREVVREIPHDGPAFVIYAMVVLFAVFIWHGSRKSGKVGPEDRDKTESREAPGQRENDPE